MNTKANVCTRLDDDQIRRLDALAQRFGVTRADLLRTMVTLCIPIVEAGHGFNLPRLLIIAEYMRLGIDALLTKLVPDDAERIPMAALAAMEKHHPPAK
jgi:hypothetical protein